MKNRLPSLLLTCALLGAAGGSLAAPPAAMPAAAPEPAAATPGPVPADGVTQLLIARGLLPSGAAPLVQTMRDRASDLVLSAMNFLGVPYRRGGNSADEGFDCSGFTRHVFEHSVGLVLPRRADEQAKSAGLQKVGREELKPGDLVFFNTLRRTFSHVGIYVGDGKFIHAPKPGASVRVEDMRIGYWSARFDGARRVEAKDDGAVAASNAQ